MAMDGKRRVFPRRACCPSRTVLLGVRSGVSLSDVDAVAVTSGPGLALCLRVGLTAAVTAAMDAKVPLVDVNHLEVGKRCGRTVALCPHVCILPRCACTCVSFLGVSAHPLTARFITACFCAVPPLISVSQAHSLVPLLTDPTLAFPYLVVLVSGGHSLVVLVKSPCSFERLVSTLDDSLGETYDKVARMINAEAHARDTMAFTCTCTGTVVVTETTAVVCGVWNHKRSAATSASCRLSQPTPCAGIQVVVFVLCCVTNLSPSGGLGARAGVAAGHMGAIVEALATRGDEIAFPLPVPMTNGGLKEVGGTTYCFAAARERRHTFARLVHPESRVGCRVAVA